MKIVLFVLIAVTSAIAFSDDFINEINSKQNLWTAGRNFPENTTLSDVRSLLGLKPLPQGIFEKIPLKYHEVNASDLPESFDARVHWSKCKTIKQIADQSSCGSCWAVSVASTISDRICIHSDGKLQTEISASNLIACNDWVSDGCGGGVSYYAWVYWKTEGIVTGGLYGSKIGCQPYPFPPCEHIGSGPKQQCPESDYDTPRCTKTCDDSKLSYEKELVYGKSVYRLDIDEEQIKAEIFKNGPVVAGFNVYNDFLQYKSGIYHYTSGSMAGGHAIRVIGWGEEKGVKYWLIANSWNEDWGEKGLFRIRRGNNECGIEAGVTAGLPK